MFKVDQWVWGNETILWGFDPDHKYTLKMIEPRPGRAGCLSLQYHHEKSESWIVLRGLAWALIVENGVVCTRVMKAGDVQNIPCGRIHRLMALSQDLKLIEPSTPDRHAADKSVTKDVVRLDCLHGRPIDPPRDGYEAKIVKECVRLTEEAIACFEKGLEVPSHNLSTLSGGGNLYSL